MTKPTRHPLRLPLLALVFALAFSGCAFVGCGLGSIPSRPIFSSVYDGAEVLGSIAELQVGAAARAAQAHTGGEVVVVTVRRMRDYGSTNIDSLARRWFEAWRIGGGALQDPARGKGVLLIVATEDRDARIELGRGFSGSASSNARRIMGDVIVPRMRSGDVEGGIEAGTEALAMLETQRFDSNTGFLNTSTRGVRGYSAFGFGGFFGGGALGIALIVLGALLRRFWLAGLGIGILLFTLFTKMIFVGLIILAIILVPASRSRRRREPKRVWSSGRGASGSW
jgi:uncharacterized membrane protein YgcG